MAERQKSRGKFLAQQDDGSYHFTYRGQRYAMRVRRHAETDTFDLIALWNVATREPVPLEARKQENRWEALLADTANRSVLDACHEAQRLIEAGYRRETS